MRYQDRRHAGRLLAAELQRFNDGKNLVVLALPRGGVPVAYEVAIHLNAPLDVLIVRKLGAPGQPELALGALASGNVVVKNPEIMAFLHDPEYALQQALHVERPELQRREVAYHRAAPRIDIMGHVCIVVDDGVATGATVIAAVRALKMREAARVIVAVPVASREALSRVQAEADEVICLQAPVVFNSVGEWYDDFSQTEDEEVRRLLAAGAAKAGR